MSSAFTPSRVNSVPVPASEISLGAEDRSRPVDYDSRGNKTDGSSSDSDLDRGDRGSTVVPDNGSEGSTVVPDNGSEGSTVVPDTDTIGGKNHADNSVINPWSPDLSASPEVNLSSLADWFSNLFKFSNNYSYAGIQDPSFYANLFQLAASSLGRFTQNLDLEKSAKLALIEKVSDWTSNLVHEQFQMALSYQSWYLQQEYNSPINQINRLAQAGLSSAFALGGLSSGNASSMAGIPSGSPVSSPSSAAEIQQQEDARKSSLLGSLISSTLSFIPGVGGAAAQLCSALWQQEAGRAMLPYNIAKAGSDIRNSAQSFVNLQSANDQMKSNMALAEFNAGKSNIEMTEQLAKGQMDVAKSRYDSEYEKYSEEYEDLAWKTSVKTKEGHTESRVLTTEQVKSILRGNTTLEDGSVIVGITSAEKLRESNINLNAGLDLPFAGKVGVSGGAHAADKDSTTNSNTRQKSKTTSVGNESEQGSSQEGYKLDGSSFRVQDAEFTSVTTRHRLPLPKYAEYLNKLRLEYERLLDNYNTLTEGNKARLHLLQDKLTRNLSKLSAGTVNANYQSVLNKFLLDSPDKLLAD